MVDTYGDIIDVGVSSGVGKALDYPFLNGCHYIYKIIIFFNVKRQDPFNDWGCFILNFHQIMWVGK
jgi:hypothetical protein